MKVSILRKNGHEIVDLNCRKAVREKNAPNCRRWEERQRRYGQ